jgi:hypothetical protein
MTTANAYLASAANICGSAYSGLVSFTTSAGGSPVELRSDGEIYARKACLVNIVEALNIQLRDFSQAPAVGASGQTVLTGVKHTGGTTLLGTRVVTAANSVVESVEHGTDINGNAVVNVTVSVQSSNGTSSGLVWSST